MILKELGVSIIVIGFNEEQNLHNTFQAILNMDYPQDLVEIIYVDSGSKDRSVEIAKTYTDKVFLEPEYPSPGRNRNRGLVEASFDIVHFVDGDLTIDPDYLKIAIPLFEEKGVHAVMGQLEEQNPVLMNRIAALENSKKIEGYSQFTATGATYLKKAILEIHGYDERIRRGEETELGDRFIAAGYKIWCTLQKMGSHNFEMSSPGEFARKYRNDAISQVQNAFMIGNTRHFINLKRRYRKAWIKFFISFMVLVISLSFKLIWIFIAFTILATMSRNKAIFKRYFKDFPGLVLIRAFLDYFLITAWWYGFFKETLNYLFRNRSSNLYQLRKQKLS